MNISDLVAGFRGSRLTLSQKNGIRVDRVPGPSGQALVVVKTMTEPGDAIAVERFRREAIILDLLAHPNIVRLLRYQDKPPRSMMLEYVPAEDLRCVVDSEGTLTLGAVCGFVEDIGAALDASHSHGIVHRDICPDNILLPKHGSARLIDFGFAHIEGEPPVTLQGEHLPDHDFVAPEQIRAIADADTRSDVYSLAAVAYYALTGTPPNRSGDVGKDLAASSSEPLRSEFTTVIARGLAADPAARYPSAGQMAADLRAASILNERGRATAGVGRGAWSAAVVPVLLWWMIAAGGHPARAVRRPMVRRIRHAYSRTARLAGTVHHTYSWSR